MSLCRIASVRVASMTGGLAGPWQAYEQLTMTPMVGRFVNCVCCHPVKWEYTQEVTANDRMFIDPTADGPIPDNEMMDKRMTGRVELYTVGVRNVLFLGKLPIIRSDAVAALKYEAVVAKSLGDAETWKSIIKKIDPDAGKGLLVSIPGVDHEAVRKAVMS